MVVAVVGSHAWTYYCATLYVQFPLAGFISHDAKSQLPRESARNWPWTWCFLSWGTHVMRTFSAIGMASLEASDFFCKSVANLVRSRQYIWEPWEYVSNRFKEENLPSPSQPDRIFTAQYQSSVAGSRKNQVGQRTQKQDGTQHAFLKNLVVWAAVLCTKST